MEDREKTHRDQRSLVLTLTAAALETAVCAFLLLRIPADAKNAFLFGLSRERLLMLAVFALLFCCEILCIPFRKTLSDRVFSKSFFGPLFTAAAVIAGYFVLLPDYRFGVRAAYYTRLRPYILWMFLTALTFAVYAGLNSGRSSAAGETLKNLTENKKFILPVLAVLLAGILFVEFTGIGKTPENSLWNKNGIPLQSIQLFSVLLVYYLMHKLRLFTFLSGHKKIPHFLLIWIIAAVVWAQVPFIPHFFAPLPMEPNLEYYPYSDASIYDLSAQTALHGWGFNLGRIFLKPPVVYVSFLSHLATGNNMERSMLFQSALYGVLPAIIFLFGSSLGGTGCGYLAAVFSILREWNALNSRSVSTVHSRLVMSEFLTQILLALFCYAVYRCIKRDKREILFAAIAGGSLTLGMFTRYNFAAFLPAALLILAFAYKKHFRAFLKIVLIMVLTGMLTAAPMIIRDSGKSKSIFYNLNRTIKKVLIAQRFNIEEPEETTPEVEITVPADTSGGENQNASVSGKTDEFPETGKEEFNTGQITQELTNKSSNKTLLLIRSMINHGMHNFISEALTLPLELTFHDLKHLYKNEGDGLWRDDWKGEFTFKQWVFIGIWILLGAVSVGCLIRQEGLAGFSIFYFWLVYAFSIGFSRSSGGRYIVPCNWIPMLLLSYLCAIISNRGKTFSVPERIYSRKSTVFLTAAVIFAFTAFFGSMAIFELILPSEITAVPEGDLSVLQERLSDREDIDWDLVSAQLENGQMFLTHGIAVYPRFYYYRGGEHASSGALMRKPYNRMTFTGINREYGHTRIFQEYMLPHTKLITDFPQDSVFRALSCKNPNNYQEILAVTVETPDGRIFTYTYDPEREFSCPVEEPVCISIDECR